MPKLLGEKVATLHLPVLGAALTVLTQEHTVSRCFKVEGPNKRENTASLVLMCSLLNVTLSALCRRMASLHLPVLVRRSLSSLRNTDYTGVMVEDSLTPSSVVCQHQGRLALQCCGSHSGFMLPDMCRELFLSCHWLTQFLSGTTERVNPKSHASCAGTPCDNSAPPPNVTV